MLLMTYPVLANGHYNSVSQIEVLARIQNVGNSVNLIRLSEGDVIPSLLQKKDLEKTISSMEPGDEALVKGYITYHTTNVDGPTKMKPIFVIESINPV